jgi:hypothetical protein
VSAVEFNLRDFSLSGYFSVFNTDAGTVDDLKEAVEQEVFAVSTETSQAVLRFFLPPIQRQLKCKND